MESSQHPSVPHHKQIIGNSLYPHMRRTAPRALLANSGFQGEQPPPASSRDPSFKRELHALTVAIWANIAILVCKLFGYGVTYSSSLQAEAVHSFVDCLNQGLLRLGLLRSRQAPTPAHPYGYAKERFVFSLISAVAFFCFGCGWSLLQGIQSLFSSTQHVENMGWALAVLAVSAVAESYSLMVAARTLWLGARDAGMAWVTYLRRQADPTTIAVLMEDGGAVLGCVVAAVCAYVTWLTGSQFWDAVGAVLVGLLLGVIAVFLIAQNHSILLGRAMEPKMMNEIQKLLESNPVVGNVKAVMSEEIGAGLYRFKAEIDFRGDVIVKRYFEREGDDVMRAIEAAMASPQGRASVQPFLKYYGERMVSAVGLEIDRLEDEIRQKFPGVHYVDLEADRGKSGALLLRSFSIGLVGIDMPAEVKEEMLAKLGQLNSMSMDEQDVVEGMEAAVTDTEQWSSDQWSPPPVGDVISRDRLQQKRSRSGDNSGKW